jgi:hypothetical protein
MVRITLSPGDRFAGWRSAGNFSIAKPTTVNTYMALKM